MEYREGSLQGREIIIKTALRRHDQGAQSAARATARGRAIIYLIPTRSGGGAQANAHRSDFARHDVFSRAEAKRCLTQGLARGQRVRARRFSKQMVVFKTPVGS
jgi:hypothetical protein